MIKNNKVYDVLKFVALIALPAISVFYLGLGDLWDLPNTDKISGTVILVDTLLGALLQISSSKFNNRVDGYLNGNGKDPDTGLPNLQMTITRHPQEILDGDVARLKIGPPPPKN